MRLRRKPHTGEKLQNFSDFVTVCKFGEEINFDAKKLFGENSGRKLYAEFGTGKGDFILKSAEKNPEINFLGIDVEAEVILKAARKIAEKNLDNVRLVVLDINRVTEFFHENEIDRLYINFCDPWPKKRHAKRRLTHVRFLEMYRKILKPGGEIYFKTDNRGLFDFSLEQFAEAGLKVRDVTNDLHANEPPENIRTEYENKFSSVGVPINRCVVMFD